MAGESGGHAGGRLDVLRMRCEECVHWPPSAMSGKPCCFCYPGTPMNYFQRKEEQKDMGNTEFTEKAKKLVREYTEYNTPDAPVFEVYVVWNAYILGNMKALLSTTVEDGMYYEVTYNKAKNEIYLDAYKKFENICFAV